MQKSLTFDLGRVRTLESGDAPALGELMFLAYHGTVEDEGQTLDEYEEHARRTLAGEYGDVVWNASFVLLDAGKVVAATVVTDWTEQSETLLAFVLVRPPALGRGIGAALVTSSGNALHDMHRADWVLAVAPGNPRSAAL